MVRYGISRSFDVPLEYAYAWLTDFRDDDLLTIGLPFPRHILRRRKDGFVWLQKYKSEGVEKTGVRIITLKPPNAWHSELINDEKEGVFDYRLTRSGKNKTKLTVTVRMTYKEVEPEPKSKLEQKLSTDWDKYRAALEKDYASGKGPTA